MVYVIHNFLLIGPQAKKDHVDVTFHVREKGRMHLGLSAHAGAQSGDAVCMLYLHIVTVFGKT